MRRSTSLSDREREILRELAKPGDHKLIAKEIGVSEELIRIYHKRKSLPKDIKDHIINFYVNRAEAITKWYLSTKVA